MIPLPRIVTFVPRPTARWRPALAGALALAAVAGAPVAGAADEAVDGMDVVSLRDSGRSVDGDGSISTHWKGRDWIFANEANRAAFEANPRAYAPGFGGNCPVKLSEGQKQPGRPDLAIVVSGTLYLTSTAGARDRLAADPGIIAIAAEQWKRLGR